MGVQMEKKTALAGLGRRKKLWDIEGYYCSVIGTCFNRSELRKIAQRKEFSFIGGMTDFQIHNRLVNLAENKMPESKVLQKLLERKYHRSVARFAKVKTVEGLKELWRLYLEKGAVAGAYWALLTHPAVSRELAAEAHGEIHMIGHDFIGEYQREKGQQEELRLRLKTAEEKLAVEKQKVRELLQALEKSGQEKADVLAAKNALQRETESLRFREMAVQVRPKPVEAGVIKAMQDRLEMLGYENTRLLGQSDQLESQLLLARKEAEDMQLRMDELEKTNLRLLQEKKEFKEELLSLEESLLGNMLSACDCEGCDEQDSATCPGPGLCGRTVLYVGGLHKMVPHYRQLVEKYGGVFVHHDGGREVSMAVLPRMLGRADVVLCPIDCVSHNACLNMKKICKRHQKPFVMMRSSGLSSLAKGLTDVMRVQ